MDDVTNTIISYENAEKSYPKASKNALASIRRREIPKSEINLSFLLDHTQNTRNETYEPMSPMLDSKASSPEKRINQQSFSNDRHRSQSSVINAKRPTSSYINANSNNVISNQSMNSVNWIQTRNTKVRLHSASTLGNTLIPIFPEKKYLKTENLMSNIIPAPRTIETRIDFDEHNQSFGQRIRKGRPISPNPAEVWARRHNVDFKQMTGRSPVKTMPSIEI